MADIANVVTPRMPITEIAKQMDVSAGTIHVRVKKMEDAGIILGSSLNIDYGKLDYHFTAFIGILLTKSNRTQEVLKELTAIPNVIEASVISGKYNIPSGFTSTSSGSMGVSSASAVSLGKAS